MAMSGLLRDRQNGARAASLHVREHLRCFLLRVHVRVGQVVWIQELLSVQCSDAANRETIQISVDSLMTKDAVET